MKNSGRQKIVSVLTLTALLMFLLAPTAQAQEVKLLPNATESDYEVQTIPPQEQNYEIRTAGVGDTVGKYVFGALGKLVNLGLKGLDLDDVDQIQLAQWLGGQVMEAALIGGNVILAGNCWEGGTPVEVEATDIDGEIIRDGAGNPVMTLGMDCGVGVEVDADGDLVLNHTDLRDAGLAGAAGNLVVQEFRHRPNLGTVDFFKDTLANNIFAPQRTQAAGTDTLDLTWMGNHPIKELWIKMRDLSYLAFTLILIVFGFMVMTRYRIDPRTTITVSMALPRIAVSLILIAFSWPIAGLMIDLMNILIELVQTYLGGALPHSMRLDIFGLIRFMIAGYQIEWGVLSLLPPFQLALQFIVRVIVFVTLIYLSFKLAFIYLRFFLLVIFAPLAFAWSALPGQEDTLTGWFKSFLVGVLSFPAILMMLWIANAFRMVGNIAPPSFSRPLLFIDIGGLLAVAALIQATKIPEAIEDALEVTARPGVSKAGVQPGKILGAIPIIGGIFK